MGLRSHQGVLKANGNDGEVKIGLSICRAINMWVIDSAFETYVLS